MKNYQTFIGYLVMAAVLAFGLIMLFYNIQWTLLAGFILTLMVESLCVGKW